MVSPVIQLHRIDLYHEDEPILRDVSCSVGAGEKLVLIGPSGHGKSTLLKIMSGLLEPTRGSVEINGSNLKTANARKRQQLLRQMGVLFQKNALFDSLTAYENVAFPMRETTEKEESEIRERCLHFLEEVGLSAAASLYPSEMSGGMQKRLGIARALALDPKIVFYDDPTAGLDPITSRRIIDLILKLQAEQGSTVVAITNDMNRAYQLADRMAMVIDGECVVTGTPQQTRAHPDMRVHQFITGQLEGPLTARLE